MVKLVVGFTRILLGLLLSVSLSFGFYFMSLPIITLIWRPESISGLWVTILTTGVGASVGGFLGWFDNNNIWSVQLLLYIITLSAALLGAYVGLQQGAELQPSQEPWKYGIPLLSLTIRGAVVGANAPLLAIWTFLELRGVWRAKPWFQNG